MHKGIPNLTRNTARSNPVNIRLHQCSAEETNYQMRERKFVLCHPTRLMWRLLCSTSGSKRCLFRSSLDVAKPAEPWWRGFKVTSQAAACCMSSRSPTIPYAARRTPPSPRVISAGEAGSTGDKNEHTLTVITIQPCRSVDLIGLFFTPRTKE